MMNVYALKVELGRLILDKSIYLYIVRILKLISTQNSECIWFVVSIDICLLTYVSGSWQIFLDTTGDKFPNLWVQGSDPSCNTDRGIWRACKL